MCHTLLLRRYAPLGLRNRDDAVETMYAIVKTGGKQFKAAKDDILVIEKIEGEAGTAVEFNEVLLVVDGENTQFGAPFLAGTVVKAEIIRQAKAKKINAFNYKPKKNERKRWGHRQPYTHVRVTEIVGA